MITNCENCSREVEDDEVERCPLCEHDGLCPDCLISHDCQGTASTPKVIARTNRKGGVT